MPHRPTSATRLLGVTLVLLGSALGACSSSPSTSTSATTVSASSIANIADLQKRLEGKGIVCKLEYEGLKQEDKTLSICVIDGEQATLTIWDKPEVLVKFLNSDVGAKGATAVGANWTVDVDSAATAQKVASALGGTVKAATGSTGSR